MLTEYFVAPELVTTDLDRLLAPLDAIGRTGCAEPTDAERQRAYALGMLAADLTAHPPSLNLLEICRYGGVSADEALTIGRALSGLLLRIAQRAGTTSKPYQAE
jgi:hypothetical protein